MPPEYKRPGQEEYLAAYQDGLAQFAQPYEEQAVAVYVQAIEAARKLHVKNEWTRKIGESLARYRPREYPVLKEAKSRMAEEDLAPVALAVTADGPAHRAAPPAAAPATDAATPSPEAAPRRRPARPPPSSGRGRRNDAPPPPPPADPGAARPPAGGRGAARLRLRRGPEEGRGLALGEGGRGAGPPPPPVPAATAGRGRRRGRAATPLEPAAGPRAVRRGRCSWRPRASPAQAADTFERAFDADPSLAWAGLDAGLLRERAGDDGRAIALYQRTLEADPGFAPAGQNLARAWIRQGKAEEGKRALQARLSPGRRGGAPARPGRAPAGHRPARRAPRSSAAPRSRPTRRACRPW